MRRMGLRWGRSADVDWFTNEALGFEPEASGAPVTAIWDTGTTWNAAPTYLTNHITKLLKQRDFLDVSCDALKSASKHPDAHVPYLIMELQIYAPRGLPNIRRRTKSSFDDDSTLDDKEDEYIPEHERGKMRPEENFFRVELPPEQWYVGGGHKNARCIPAIMSIDVPQPYGPNTWILGEIFMRHFVTVFDRGQGGYAELYPSVDELEKGEKENM